MTRIRMIKSLLRWQNWYCLEELEEMSDSKLKDTYDYYGDMPLEVQA